MRNDPATRSPTEDNDDNGDTVEDVPRQHGSSHAHAGPSGPAQPATVQADPLPSKRGEIGFQEPTHEEDTTPAQSEAAAALPARHPADRDAAQQADAPRPASPETASTHSSRSTSKRLFARLRRKHVPRVHGVRITTLLLLVLHLALFVGTIVSWVLVTNYLSSRGSSTDPTSLSSFGTTQIFVHVVFGLATLAQLVFVERRIYRVRAERWVHANGPGLPVHDAAARRTSLGLAPWNRPPLPTYAAALAQSGVGTGDVEDNIIAVVPPPAYGNTRGSTLLLAALLSDAARMQRAEARARAISQANADGSSLRASWQSAALTEPESRPVSYVSRDEEWEERLRTAHLGAALTRLESAHVRG